jgi:hypothetical protein
MYEKTTGIFCVGCEPKDIEEIRQYRTVKAKKQADRLVAKAERLEAEAERRAAPLEAMRGDTAFFTQPGRIPFRDRIFRSYNKAAELSEEAKKARERTDGVMRYKTAVAGDAERQNQEKRDSIKAILKVGMVVNTFIYDIGIVEKINKKTALVRVRDGSCLVKVDLSFLEIIPSVV